MATIAHQQVKSLKYFEKLLSKKTIEKKVDTLFSHYKSMGVFKSKHFSNCKYMAQGPLTPQSVV